MPETILGCKELSILLFIENFHKEKGYAPSLRQICAATGFKSTSLVSYYVDKLVAAGKIKKDPFAARSIVLVENS